MVYANIKKGVYKALFNPMSWGLLILFTGMVHVLYNDYHPIDRMMQLVTITVYWFVAESYFDYAPSGMNVILMQTPITRKQYVISQYIYSMLLVIPATLGGILIGGLGAGFDALSLDFFFLASGFGILIINLSLLSYFILPWKVTRILVSLFLIVGISLGATQRFSTYVHYGVYVFVIALGSVAVFLPINYQVFRNKEVL